eukprot:TRINITY_DN2401_c0_g2_i1.p2 TRINITY_DN2401_c0_g2~~TRINITY_DN2401_c0_g2_i1.p2  ORF type:complete len:100 (+),score=11.40 TRINITY_DN2401_c0_g2_i1:911-1210(+)
MLSKGTPLFRVKLYQLSRVLQQFPPHWKLNNLYIHNVIAHSTDFFSICDLLLVSCEKGEQAFARLTRYARTKSNQVKHFYLNFLVDESLSQISFGTFRI